MSLYLSSIETPCSLFGYHRLDFREMSYFVLNIVRMREHHQWERKHLFIVFLHISLARLRTCASASAGVGISHGSTRPVAITPRLRNISLFFPPQEICVCSPSCCSSLLFVGDSECFGVLALSSSFALASFRGWISFCLHDAKIMISVWPRHLIAGGIRGGRCDAVPLVSIMLWKY